MSYWKTAASQFLEGATKLPVDLVIGGVKHIIDLPRSAAQFGSEIGQWASDKLDESRGIKRDITPSTGIGILNKSLEQPKILKPTNTYQKIGGVVSELPLLGEGLTLSAGPLAKAGTGILSKVVSPVLKTTKFGETALPYASPIIKTLAQGGADFTVGSGIGALQGMASKKTPEEIKKDALTFGAISALAPLAVSGSVGAIKGAARQVGQGEGFLTSLGNVTKTAGSEAGLLPKNPVLESRAGNLSRLTRKGLDKAEESLSKRVEAQTPKTIEVTSPSGVVESFPTSQIPSGQFEETKPLLTRLKEKGERGALKAVQMAQDFGKNWINQDAPIISRFGGKLKESGASEETVANVEGAVRDMRTSHLPVIERTNQQREDLLRIFGSQSEVDKNLADLNRYSDLLTKVETPRTDVAGLAQVRDDLAKLEKRLVETGQLDRVKAAHEKIVRQYNSEQLDRDVASGLISPEKAAEYRASKENYSRLYVKDHIDEAKSLFTGSRKDLQNNKTYQRLLEAEADLSALPATEANILADLVRSSKQSRNNLLNTMVRVDEEHGSGVFQKLWTNEDQQRLATLFDEVGASKELRERILSDAQLSFEEAKKLVQQERGAKALKNILRGKVGEDVKLAQGKARATAAQGRAEQSVLVDKKQETLGQISKERELLAQRKQFGDRIKQTIKDLKSSGTLSEDLSKELSALQDLRGYGAIDDTELNLLRQQLEKIKQESLRAGGKVSGQSQVRAVFDGLEQKVEQRTKALANNFLKDIKASKVSLKELSQYGRRLADEVSAKYEAARTELFELIKKRSSAKSAEDAVTLYRNGQPEVYKVTDKHVADYFAKSKASSEDSMLMNGLKAAANFTRATATTYNPLFFLSNTIRDVQSAVLNTEVGHLVTPEVIAKNFERASTWVSAKHSGGIVDPLVKEAFRIGGPVESWSSGFKATEDIAGMLRGKKKTLLESARALSETSELATRLSILDAAKQAGITDPRKLRDMMRNGTVDFAVIGDKMRQLNQVVPFLNAAFQGTLNSVKAIIKNPAYATRKGMIIAGLPEIAIESYNNIRFPEAAKSITEQDKKNNYILITNQYTDPKDGHLRYTALRIPKGEGAAAFSMLGEKMFEGKIKDIPGAVFSSFAPASGQAVADRLDFGGSVYNLYEGLRTNKNWAGYSITPDYMNVPGRAPRTRIANRTSPTAIGISKFLAGLTGGTNTKQGKLELDPNKLEFALRTIFAGVGSTAISASDTFLKRLAGEDLNPADTVGMSRFFTKRDVKDRSEEEQKSDVQFQQTQSMDKFNKQQEIMPFVQRLREAKTKEERAPIKAEVEKMIKDGVVDAGFKDRIVEEFNKGISIYGVNPSDSNLLKGKKMFEETQGMTPEEKNKRFKAWEENNVFTKGAQDAYVAWKIYKEVLPLPKGSQEREAAQQKWDASGKMNPQVFEMIKQLKELEQ